MNKTKKIATAVVGIVLASSMLVSMTACNSSSKTSTVGGLEVSATLNDDGTVNYNYASDTALNMNVGYSTARIAQITYTTSNLGGSVTMPDGKSYSANSLKPAWQALEDELDVKFTDSYTNLEAAAQITSPINTGTLGNYNVVTGQADTIVNQATASKNTFLDLSQYLDYMPNFKKFLEDNPIVYLSLTSDTSSGAIYYAPYFDGNDDIEKYELAKKNWVSRILDNTTPTSGTITFAAQATAKKSALKGENVAGNDLGIDGTSSSVESFMGTTGSWWIESTDPNDTADTVTITVSYENVINALKDSTSALYTAVSSALSGTSATVQTTSGNIVDIQNQVIDATNGTVTGAQLTDILKAYIDVCYLDSNNNKYYTNRSDVFNGADAAWDVDLLVALMRCCVTYGNTNLGTSTGDAYIYGVTGRQVNTQRMNDMVSLAGELYGVRGLTSRYNYTYIDSEGDIQEARADEASYDAMDKMHAMVEEGLYNANEYQASGTNSYYTAATNTCEALLGYDYVQTQTANGGYQAMGISAIASGKGSIETDYDFEPIVNPVSKWNDGDTSTDENADGIKYDYDGSSKYMRFTESWRSVKNTGWAVPYASVSGDPDKLAATLALIDYFFSNDGQILMSFGPQSSTNSVSSAVPTSGTTVSGNTDDGWWYAEEVEPSDVKTGATSISDVADYVGGQYYIKSEYQVNYFCYDGKIYSGTSYNGKNYPQMTNSSLAFYYGYTVAGTDENGSTYTTNQTGESGDTYYYMDSNNNYLDKNDNIIYWYDSETQAYYDNADFEGSAVAESDMKNRVSYTIAKSGIAASGKLSYTNYARYIMGAALPIGNKLQAFEFQCTSDQGIAGGNIVGYGLVNGTISHVYQTVGTDNGKGYWYTEVPTTLPYDSATSSWINRNVTALDGTVFVGTSSAYHNFYVDIIYYGLGQQTYQLTYLSDIYMPNTAADCISQLETKYSLSTYESYMQEAWADLCLYYEQVIKAL